MNSSDISQTTLPNNLKILCIPFPNTESVYVTLIGKVGRRAELENEVGAAHLVEHLFFDGTSKRPSPLAVNEYLERYGGQHNGVTNQETVRYYVKILSEYSEVAFEYLSDIFFNSKLENLEKEKQVIKQEAATKRDDPVTNLARLRSNQLYPKQAIGRTIFEEEENLSNMNKEILKNYIARTYVTENFVLVACGKIHKEEILLLAEKYFSQFKVGNKISYTPAKIEKSQKIDLYPKNLSQTKVSICFRGFPELTNKEIQAQILSIFLGRGFSSRLVDRIRNELHLAYFIRSSHHSFSDTGFFEIDTHVRENDLQLAVSEIFKEIRKVVSGDLKKEELEKAKNMLLSSYLFGLEELEAYSQYFGIQVLFDKEIKGIDYIKKEINGTTLSDIIDTAKYIFTDKPKIVALTKNLKELYIEKG